MEIIGGYENSHFIVNPICKLGAKYFWTLEPYEQHFISIYLDLQRGFLKHTKLFLSLQLPDTISDISLRLSRENRATINSSSVSTSKVPIARHIPLIQGKFNKPSTSFHSET